MSRRRARSPHRRLGAVSLLPAAALVLAWAGATWGQAALTDLGDPGATGFDVVIQVPDPAALQGRVALTGGANVLEVAFGGGKATIGETAGGPRKELASGALPTKADAMADPTTVVVHRDGPLLRVVAGAATVCEAYSRAVSQCTVGYDLPGLPEGAALVQPLGDITFAEDFTWENRSQAAEAWEKTLGSWTTAKAGDWTNPEAIRRQQAQTSTNLFAYVGHGEPMALSVTGYPHWTNYQVEAGAKSLTGATVGLVAYYTGPNDYLVFRATSQASGQDDAGRYQLVLVSGGQPSVLAEAPGGLVTNEWYKLRLRLHEGTARADVDGVNVLSADGLTALSRGKIGLCAVGSGGAKFDDVSVTSYRVFTDDYANSMTARWEAPPDGWETAKVGDSRGHVIVRKGAAPGIALAGDETWSDYSVRADVDTKSGTGALLLNWESPDAHNAVRWQPGGAAELVARRDGQDRVLASGQLAAGPDGWAMLDVSAEGNFLRVRSGGTVALEGIDDAASGGRFGFQAGTGARFDKFAAYYREPNQAEEITRQFTREDTMREWAQVAGAWLTPRDAATDFGIWWNKGDFYGDVSLAGEIATPKDGERWAGFILCSDGSSADAGYQLTIRGTGEQGLHLQLNRAGAIAAEAAADGQTFPAHVTFAKRGSVLSAAVGERTVLEFRDAQPLSGSRVGVKQGGLPVSMNSMVALSSDQRDYTFSSSPTDWFVRTGTWDITSRWTCQPEWTWFSGVSRDGPAAIWCKRGFTGDTTVELYASLKMLGEAGERGHGYEHPHDINIELCGDGASLGSGYSFVIGGYMDSKTQILKNGRVLAETNDPNFLLPKLNDGMPDDMNQFHRHWWQIRAQKQGSTLRLFLENRLALEVEDPEILTGGHVGLWTWEGGIMVARAKIYGAESGETLAPQVSETAKLGARDASERPGNLTLTSETHPAIISDFERGLGDTARLDDNLAASICLDTTNSASGKGSLRVTNEEAGGTFAFRAFGTDFRIGEANLLAFDYRVTPEVKVNLLLKGSASDYIVAFTGGQQVTPGQVLLGVISGVVADGQWHHAVLDLGAALAGAGGDTKNARISEVQFGNFTHDRGLSLGLTGNPAGATYWLDNLSIYTAGGPKASFQIADKRRQATGFSYVIDQSPTTDPAQETRITGAKGEFSAEGLQPGTWYAHVAACGADGAWQPALHHEFRVDGDAPRVSMPTGLDEPMAAGLVTIPVLDEGSGIRPESIRVSVSGQEFTAADPAVRLGPDGASVQVDLASALKSIANGQVVEVALTHVEDRVGHSAAQPQPAEVKLTFSADKDPPDTPRIVSGGDCLTTDTFESGTPRDMGQWQAIRGSGSEVALDDTTAASGRRSLRLYCTDSRGAFQTYIRREPFDAGKYRVISFDYRIDPWTRVDLIIQTGDGVYRLLKMTDNDGEYPSLGRAIDPKTADGQWHHAEINLHAMLAKRIRKPSGFTIRSVRLGGTGWPGNPRGSSLNIDNLSVFAVTSAKDGMSMGWQAEDASGIAGASYVVDDQPDTVPPETVATQEMSVVCPAVADGTAYFHLRLVDGAGNWGKPIHQACIIDNDGLTIGEPTPGPGAVACTSEIHIPLTDRGTSGVDPASLKLVVAGQEFTIENGGLEYLPAPGELIWRGQNATPQPVALPDKSTVTVKLADARDFAGNGPDQPLEYQWTMDFALDTEPPPAPKVASVTHPTAFFEPFEGTPEQGALGECRGSAGTQLAVDPTTKASGDSSLKVTFAEGKVFRAEIRHTPFDVEKNSKVGFDYCVPPGVQADLLFLLEGGQQVLVNFTDNERLARSRIPGVIADGKWHSVRNFDLKAAARQVAGNAEGLVCTCVAFIDAGQPETPLGSSFWVDNFVVYREGSTAPRLSWKASDPTGIQGFSHVFDDNPGTIPDDTLEGTDTSLRLDPPKAGVHFFHIRALDGSGRWSPTAHYTVVQR